MKKTILYAVISMLVMATATAQNSVTLTFTCQTTDGGYLQPDSITIENLTRNWIETIYYPDTVYTLNVGTSVPYQHNDYGMQMMPNPFDGTTRVLIQSPKTENVKITLTDMGGRICAEYSGLLQEGVNQFSVTLSTPRTYVLTVQSSSGNHSLKMENVGRAGTNSIKYEGVSDINMPVLQLRSSSSHAFELGDEMRFTVCAYVNDTTAVYQSVTQIQNANDDIVVTVPVTQNTLNLSSCPTNSFRTNETGFGNRVSYVQDYDGNEYQVVQLGSQCWMKMNLKVTHTPSGSEISIGNTYSSTTPYRYYPNNDLSNVSSCGYLYNWKAVMVGAEPSSENPSGVQGLCPDGWHVPSDAEWIQLTDFVKNNDSYVCGSNPINIAKALAATTNWNHSTGTCTPGYDTTTNNATGFTAIPVGVYSLDEYLGYSNYANFWSSSEYSGYHMTCFNLSFNNTHVSSGGRYKYDGVSVRCVRNQQNSGGGGTTSGTLPSLYNTTISNVNQTSAYATSIVTNEGSSDVTARGFCWSSLHYPTLADSHIIVETGIGFGHFSGTLMGLAPGTTYYIRSWATNDAGTAYGNPLTFKTASVADGQSCPSATTVTDVDGNVYNTVQIGNQCWMKENLRATHYADGTGISFGGSLSCVNDVTTYSYVFPFFYNNSSVNTALCGYLYNWASVMHGSASSNTNPSGVQGICPNGWHVPSSSEWNQLISYVSAHPTFVCNNSSGMIAKSLCSSTSGWYQSYCYYGEDPLDFEVCAPGYYVYNNNATGFSARPAGSTDGVYENSLSLYGEVPVASFWTSTQSSSDFANKRDIYGVMGIVFNNTMEKVNALSVRCLRD